MGYFDFFSQKPKVLAPVRLIKNNIALFASGKPRLLESGKGVVKSPYENLWDQRFGEKHPYDMKQMSTIYSQVPIIYGSINKYVDFCVGPGFTVKTKNDVATGNSLTDPPNKCLGMRAAQVF